MSWHYDPFKPMSEKTPADWATDYMIYEDVTRERDSGSGDGRTPKPPKEPPSGGGSSGCGGALIVTVLAILTLVLFAMLLDTCGSGTTHATTRYVYSWETTTTTAATTEDWSPTTSYRYTSRYTTRYRYTMRAGTTRDDPYDAHGYIDADDFAAENWEEFDDYDEAYDYYEDYMAGYE